LQELVGPSNIIAYDKVQAMAWYLVGLKNSTSPLQCEVSNIERVWNDLHEYDTGRVVSKAWHRTKQATGRLRPQMPLVLRAHVGTEYRSGQLAQFQSSG